MSGDEESTAQEQPTRLSLVSPSDAVPGNFKPSLVIDVGKDAILVRDPNTNTLVASAPLAQVTATPAEYKAKYATKRRWPRRPARIMAVLPILVVCLSGARRLTIGCMETGPGLGVLTSVYRFSWRGSVLAETDPAYFVSGAGWLTLVEKFGLAPQLEDSRPPGAPTPWYQQPRGQRVLRRMVIGGLVFGVVACVVVPICIAIVSHILHSR